jgi:hypothetical protein
MVKFHQRRRKGGNVMLSRHAHAVKGSKILFFDGCGHFAVMEVDTVTQVNGKDEYTGNIIDPKDSKLRNLQRVSLCYGDSRITKIE